MNIVFFGDSITQSGRDGGWTDELQNQIGATHHFVNAGIGGDTTAMALDRFARDVAPHNAQIVVIEFGINDCYVAVERTIARVSADEYGRNLREIVRLVQSRNAVPVLVINHLPQTGGTEHSQGNGAPLEENLRPYNQIARDIAFQNVLSVVDFPILLSPDEAREMLNDDKVHLSAAGQKIYAHRVLDMLRPLLDEITL